MSASSRRKGVRAEQEVVNIFREHGIPARRRWEDQRMPGGQADGDLEIGEDIYAEVRRRETLSIPAWLREVKEKAGERNGVLIFRRSREPWSVALSLEAYIEMLKELDHLRDALARIANTYGVTDGDLAEALREFAFSALHPEETKE